jgi:hypothetical protein
MGLKVGVQGLSAAGTETSVAQTIEFLAQRDAIEICP